jgi:hypothetical protein
VAAIISIVETCRRLQIPVREYLSAVLPGLENFPANRVNELTSRDKNTLLWDLSTRNPEANPTFRIKGQEDRSRFCECLLCKVLNNPIAD